MNFSTILRIQIQHDETAGADNPSWQTNICAYSLRKQDVENPNLNLRFLSSLCVL